MTGQCNYNTTEENVYRQAMLEVRACIDDGWEAIRGLESQHQRLYELFERLYKLDLEQKEELKRIEE